MTATDFINSREALQVLGLYNPEKHRRPKHEYLQWLVERQLLTRAGTNHRNIKYRRSECQDLFERHINEGLSLTTKPQKSAA